MPWSEFNAFTLVVPNISARKLAASVDPCGYDTLVLGTGKNLVLVCIQATLLNALCHSAASFLSSPKLILEHLSKGTIT